MKDKKHYADLKLPLIDLESGNTETGGKQELFSSVQPERLSEGDNMYCIYWIHLPEHDDIHFQGYVGITSDFKRRMQAHIDNKKEYHFKNAINKYGWKNLVIEIIQENLTLREVLELEEKYRPIQNIGWNSQKGGLLGVEKEWYNIPENKEKHRLNTSKATKLGIAQKDTTEKRSKRAKENWIKNKESYKNVSKGSNNPRAKLNEEQVKCIKCELIPQGIKDKIIGDMYGVKDYVIAFIRKGKNWKHVICDSPDHKQID